MKLTTLLKIKERILEDIRTYQASIDECRKYEHQYSKGGFFNTAREAQLGLEELLNYVELQIRRKTREEAENNVETLAAMYGMPNVVIH